MAVPEYLPVDTQFTGCLWLFPQHDCDICHRLLWWSDLMIDRDSS